MLRVRARAKSTPAPSTNRLAVPRRGAPGTRPRRQEIAAGLRDSLGVGIGILPLGMALGVLVIQAGMPWWLAPALSVAVFAGSVELLLVGMIAAATPLLTIAVTVFAVNSRHAFYALSFPIDRVRRGPARWYSIYALIDEAYATYVLLPPERLTSARIVTGQLAMQSYWVGGGLIGVAVASALPQPIEGFEFALVALFVVMTLDAVRGRREIPSALLAGLATVVALVTAPEHALLSALVLFTAFLFGRYWLTRVRGTRDDDPDGTGPAGGAQGADRA